MIQGIDYIGVGVGAIIVNKSGQLFLSKRSNKTKNERNLWEFPGGAVQFGETLVNALKREIKEEFGVLINVIGLLDVVDHILPCESQHWVSPTYICELTEGTPRINEPSKCSEIGWFNINEIPQNISFPTMISYKNYRKKLIIMKKYDVVIIGTGPAGLMTAYGLMDSNKPVLLLDLGHSYQNRICTVDQGGKCQNCDKACNVISGFGGCIHYGDAIKLSLMPVGKRLTDLIGFEKSTAISNEIIDLLTKFVESPIVFKNEKLSEEKKGIFSDKNIDVKPYPVAVISETNVKRIIETFYKKLVESPNVEIDLKLEVLNVKKVNSHFLFESSKGKKKLFFKSDSVVFATGRQGYSFLNSALRKFGIEMERTTPSFGVRFEMNSRYLNKVGSFHPDFKLAHRLDDQKVKTFCFCGGENGGRLKYVNYQNNFSLPAITLDGHVTVERSQEGEKLSGNIGLLTQLSISNTEKYLNEAFIPKYNSLNNGKPIVQRFDAFKNKQSETKVWKDIKAEIGFEPSIKEIEVGNVFELFDDDTHRIISLGFETIMNSILEYQNFDQRVSSIAKDILVIAPAVEFIWNKVPLDMYCQTKLDGCFVVGDAAGYAQGIFQAMIMGGTVSKRLLEDF